MSILHDIKCPMCFKDYRRIVELKSHVIRKHQVKLCDIRYYNAKEIQDLKTYGVGATPNDLDTIAKRIHARRWLDIEYSNKEKMKLLKRKISLRETGVLGRVMKTNTGSIVVYVHKSEANELIPGEYVKVRPIGVTVPFKTRPRKD